MYQMTANCTKWTLNVPFVRKIDKMDLKITTSSIARPSKINPNSDFWFENICTVWQHCQPVLCHNQCRALTVEASGPTSSVQLLKVPLHCFVALHQVDQMRL
jgi:hypothetical protein